MNRVFLFLVLAGIGFSDYVPGEILVKFKEKRGIQTLGIEIQSQDFLFDNIYRLKLKKDTDIFRTIDKFKNNPDVVYAEPNYIRRIADCGMENGTRDSGLGIRDCKKLTFPKSEIRNPKSEIEMRIADCKKVILNTTPNDTYFNQQWGLNKILAPQTWDIEKGTENVIIAILDTGIDYTHPDLDDKVILGWDFAYNDGTPTDVYGHGSHVAGIAAAETDNGTGCAGLAWNCKLLAVKCLDDNGYGTDSDISLAIRYAADYPGVKIINMSFGSSDVGNTLKSACDYAYGTGTLLVAAAGNSYTQKKFYPAGYDNVMAVAATDSNDQKASFSNYGNWVDIAAPGVNILSTVPYSKKNPSGYVFWNGTSMASPFVAGLGGLLFSKYSTATNAWVFEEIRARSDNIKRKDFGRINVYYAISGENRAPTPFSIIQPENNGWTLSLYPIFKWSKSEDPDWGDEVTYSILLDKETVATKIRGTLTSWIPDFSHPLSLNTTYSWQVIAIDSRGSTTLSDTSTFTTTSLIVYPNPAKFGQTVIFRGTPLSLKEISISIYTSAGELVQRLPAGNGREVFWDTKKIASGVYLYIISNPDKIFASGKIGVIK